MAFQDNPTLNEVIRLEIDRVLSNMNTSMPGKIVSYDIGKGEAVVKPSFKRKLRTESGTRELPLISGVRVCFPKMGSTHIRMPVKAGDEGLLIFSQRSLDRWMTRGGEVDPQDPRKFHLSDATFWPGLVSDSNVIAPKGAAESLEIVNKDAYIEIKESGQIFIKNDKAEVIFSENGKYQFKGENEELMATLVQLLDTLINALIITGIGPQPFFESTVTALNEVKAKLEELKK